MKASFIGTPILQCHFINAAGQPALLSTLKRVLSGSTCGRIHITLDQVLILVNPFAVALEVDLSGRGRAAGEGHRLVLNDINIIRLHQEVWQQVREGRRKWMRYSGRMLSTCESKRDEKL